MVMVNCFKCLYHEDAHDLQLFTIQLLISLLVTAGCAMWAYSHFNPYLQMILVIVVLMLLLVVLMAFCVYVIILNFVAFNLSMIQACPENI